MIEHITANGFKLLNEFEADLSDANIIIGANASGKSSVIRILRLVSDLMHMPVDDAFNLAGGVLSVLPAQRIPKTFSWAIRYRAPKRVRLENFGFTWSDTSFVYEGAIDIDTTGGFTVRQERLRFAEPAEGHSQPLKLLEATDRRSLIYDFRNRQLVDFDSVPAVAGPGGNDAASAPELLAQSQSEVEAPMMRLARMRFFKEYPLQSWLRAFLATGAYYPQFDVGESSPIRTKAADIKATTLLEERGENLGTVLHEMFTRFDYDTAADELRSYLRLAFPAIEDIRAETSFGAQPKVLVRVREQGLTRPIEIWELSDGVLRFLCLATALLNPVAPSFVAVDEPELGLHPRLMSIVADMIKTAAARTQVIAVTHSPELLNQFELADVVVMRRNNEKVSWDRPADRLTLQKLLEPTTGVTLADLHRTGELEVGA